ncbi:hypothetical protein [Legionella jordanis]|uniref:Uncharacterized protein n=1 Tax=Legionella jordanis TaxID=456 RepID=A0A0W0VCJ2_9GAMM|nr:hypothetical protein [Legionella jordanis]KTD17851.1 hypothetical protein Ljor_2157 [Legionella jordanis]RMX02450.1 hypothetical protein EAW55_09380 [Legionella jordanis]RMX21707.1 hypothetical protein EAS68_02840 [Legionella jordanis]VEH11212.1 Uncharacterised protein [Legionella jordanis]HAT8713820.1 hypothetical protein [Legionella jordanis]
MKERHYAYKVTSEASGLVCTQAEFEEARMLDLLIEIQNNHREGLYWILKQRDSQEKEPLCIIDCYHNRIYYHYSGEVEDIASTIQKLTK